ncbi:MAG: hypothetical protein ACRDNK_03850 [Solirubrobacteraceae bacterium]
MPATTARGLLSRSGQVIRSDAAIFAVLTVWAFAPLVALAAHVAVSGGVLVGTNGADFFDQFQYLAWIRDEGSHVLASNLWLIGGTPHDYLHPMYLISGLLWRLGLSIQLAYLIWKPVALLVLFVGFALYARRLLVGRWAAMSALALALFYESPVLAIATWTGHLSPLHRFQLVLTTDDATASLNLWGFEHAAIALGLMPVFLLACERLLADADRQRRIDPRLTIVAGFAGLLVAWLHPWQGVTLLSILAVVWAMRPSRRRLSALFIPGAATVAPLLYGVALTRFDRSWSSFQSQSATTGTGTWWALLASFGPLVALALAGARRSGDDGERMLLLWPLACAGVYLIVPQFPPHALAGVTLPLAILAVRGWGRVRTRIVGRIRAGVPPALAGALALAAVLAGTVPAMILHAQGVRDSLAATTGGALTAQEFRLSADQAAAMSYLDRAARRGGVLAPWLLSMSVPAFTGRAVFAGHPQWQPHGNFVTAGVFFDPATYDPTGARHREILRASRAVYVLADCHLRPSLTRQLAPLARPVRQFGCLTVFETAAEHAPG